MRIGIFGGSFDPIHLGHLILAEQCREQARLDQVWFVPSSTSPFKPNGPIAKNRNRLDMLELAIAGQDAFQVNDSELLRGGVSYTVDTLRELTSTQAGNEWFLMLGGDSLEGFSEWREPREICRLALPLVFARSSSTPNLERLREYVDAGRFELIQKHRLTSRRIDISSTDLRARIATRQSIRYLTTRAVEVYIQNNHLYLPE